jgi:hypothetical protein
MASDHLSANGSNAWGLRQQDHPSCGWSENWMPHKSNALKYSLNMENSFEAG